MVSSSTEPCQSGSWKDHLPQIGTSMQTNSHLLTLCSVLRYRNSYIQNQSGVAKRAVTISARTTTRIVCLWCSQTVIFRSLGGLLSEICHLPYRNRHWVTMDGKFCRLANRRVHSGPMRVFGIDHHWPAVFQKTCNGTSTTIGPAEESRYIQDILTDEMEIHSACQTSVFIVEYGVHQWTLL